MKTIYWFKVAVIILSVYFSWITILYGFFNDDSAVLEAIPFTILTVYVWREKNK